MYQKIILKNKVRLILAPAKGTTTVTLLVLVRAGSRYENQNQRGLSHFIEHMMFKGTAKRPTSMDIAKEIDGIGAEFNAFTGKEFTGYYIKTNPRHLDLAVDVLADMLLHSKFNSQEITKEKGVIMEEINMYEDNPLMLIDDLLEQTIFQGNRLGKPIIGEKKIIANLTKKDFDAYLNKFYSADNVVIGLAGNFKEKQVAIIEKRFNFSGGSGCNEFAPVNINQKQPRVLLRYKKTEQAHVAIGFPALAFANVDLPALQVLAVVLGGNMSSRLFINVRERKGLCYFINASLNVFEDTGALAIFAGLDKTRIFEAIKLINTELQKIKKGIGVDELKRAQKFLIGKMSLDLEDSYYLAKWYVHKEILLGRAWSPQVEIAKINQVSLKQVKAVANQIINFHQASLAVIGPFKEKAKFEKLLI